MPKKVREILSKYMPFWKIQFVKNFNNFVFWEYNLIDYICITNLMMQNS
jgi:hypothetical protein